MALSEALSTAADMVDYLAEQARLEDKRRQQVRDFASQHDDFGDHVRDFFTGVDVPPDLTPAEPPSPQLLQPPVAGDRQQNRSMRGSSGGVSSADPKDLTSAAQVLGEAAAQVPAGSVLAGWFDDFTAQCKYGIVEVGDLFAQLDRWRSLNDGDVEWLYAVAKAFQAAGSGVIALPNTALRTALRAAGTPLWRTDLDITSPGLSGIDLRTGYLEDPVNSATGNFIEPETDLAFTAASAPLALSRMYNSVQAVRGQGGVFGPGWASVLDQCLLVKSGCVEWVREDGRHIVFPLQTAQMTVPPTTDQESGLAEDDTRPVEQWRAQGNNLWLGRVPVSQLPKSLRAPKASHWVWIISDNHGSRWVFTESGAWVSSGSSQRSIVHATRKDDLVTAIETSWGRKITVSYDGTEVASVTSSDGRCVQYSYDDQGRLVEVNGPGGSRRYEWDNALITTVADASGTTECINNYDDRGRISSQQTANGRTVYFRYLPGGVTAASDADGANANTWICDAYGRTTGVVDAHGGHVSMAYDSFGNMVRCVDRAGNVTSHRYDQRGRLTHTDLPIGGTVDCSWDDADRLVSTTLANGARTTLDYEAADRDPVRVTDPCGGVTCLEWNNGLLLHAMNPVGVSLRFSYDHHGDLVSLENADGKACHLIRDDAGRIVKTISPGGVTTRFGYDDAGHLLSVIAPDGAIWAHRRDVAGRLIELVAPDGGSTKWEYRPDGQIARVIDPLGHVIKHSYDHLGNVAGMQLPDGNVWGFAHDALSRLIQIVAPDEARWTYAYDVDGNLSGVTDPAGFASVFTDGLTTSIISDGHGHQLHRIDTDPYGLPTAVTDATGAQQIVTRDLCGRPVEFQDESGAVTYVERDLAGRIVALISPTGLHTSYRYDACGRMITVTDPAGGVTSYSYTPDFQVATVTDPTGEIARYEYDAMGRVVLSHVPGGP